MKKFMVLVLVVMGLEVNLYANTIVKKLEKACQGGDTEICYTLGILYSGEKQDLPKAIECFEQACKGGDTMGCSSLAIIYSEENEDSSTVTRYLEKACEDGDMEVCTLLGVGYVEGESVKQDLPKAIEYFEQACKGEELLGCTYLEVIKLLLLSKSKKLSPLGMNNMIYISSGKFNQTLNSREAKEFFSLGLMYEQNKEYHKAKEYYERACKGGESKGCSHLGLMYEQNKEYHKAKEYYERACKEGDTKGCSHLETINKFLRQKSTHEHKHIEPTKDIFNQETHDALYKKIRKKLFTWKRNKGSNWKKNKLTIKFKVFYNNKITFSIIRKSSNNEYNKAISIYVTNMSKYWSRARHKKKEPYEIEVRL